MADNTTLNPGASGDTIRDIDKGGAKTQCVLVDIGGTGAEMLWGGGVSQLGAPWVVSVSGLVSVQATALDIRALSSATDSIAAVQLGSWTVATTGTTTVSGTVAATQSGAWTVASTQSGTWTVQPGNTANTTAWLVTGTGGTFPATQSGTWTVEATQSGTWNIGTVTAVTAITNALPAGSNSIGQVTANAGTNLNTSALALESGGNLATLAGVVTSNRAAVNLISGQAGVAANNGTVGATTQQVVQGRNGTAELTSASINAASSGDNTLVAAVSSQTTKVYKLFLVVAAAVNVKFKDGAGTDLTGAMSLAAGGSITLDFDREPWFTTSTNTAFILNLSGAVQVSGRIYYITN